MSPVADWSISKTWAIEPPTGAAYDAAYVVRLTDGAGSTHDLVIEFEAPSAVTSVGYADEIARRFRGGGRLPSHVIVDLQQALRVVADPSADSYAPAEFD
jgi:hypothetical protein